MTREREVPVKKKKKILSNKLKKRKKGQDTLWIDVGVVLRIES